MRERGRRGRFRGGLRPRSRRRKGAAAADREAWAGTRRSPTLAGLRDRLQQRTLGGGSPVARIRGMSGLPGASRGRGRSAGKSSKEPGARFEAGDAVLIEGFLADAPLKIIGVGVGVKSTESPRPSMSGAVPEAYWPIRSAIMSSN